MTVSSALLFGMVIVLLGCLRPQLAGRLGIDEERGRPVGGMNFFLVPLTLLGGILADAWDVRGVVLIGSLLTALALVSLLSATTFRGRWWPSCSRLAAAVFSAPGRWC